MRTPLTRIFLADDHITVLLGIKSILDAQPDMQIVGYATDGRETLDKIDDLFQRQSLPIDVLILDIGMPNMNGIETATLARQRWPQMCILALSMHEDTSYVSTLMEAGASGYILKRSAADELVRAIRAVAAGKRYIDPALSDAMAQTLIRNRSSLRGETSGMALSEREEEVMRLIAQGYTNKEAAVQIGVSVKTVETYKSRSMEKLGLDSRADIVRYALTQGWLQTTE